MDTTLLHKFNNGLQDIREIFHKTGRLDDSNTKLDEISKLLCLEISSLYKDGTNIPSLSSILKQNGTSNNIIRSINDALSKIAKLDIFSNSNGESLLGSNPKLALPESEGELARKMAQLIVDTFEGHINSVNDPKTFEIVNESFGHFIRDNFRNNIEDAQYMTPPEVVNFICEMAINETKSFAKENDSKKIITCDPSCGVGSFLAQFYKAYLHSPLLKERDLQLIGQDKVDRMARLAKLNLLLFGIKDSVIERGNSLLPESILDKYYEKCDLILTNPPFGARFHTTELSFHSSNYFPCLHDFIQSTDTNIDSEILFLDRYLSLLRPQGSAFVVVPDAIISSTGLPQLMREYLSKNCTVVSITELPAVTFAQAGTRTKTCVIHFRKQRPNNHGRIYFACAKSLGFEVASRKGVPFKRYEGQNDLTLIKEAFNSANVKPKTNENIILSSDPSCVSISSEKILHESWTPNHHSAIRYSTLAILNEQSTKGGFELVRLRDAVMLPNQYSRRSKSTPDTRCISVLHVGDYGSLNVRELMDYTPKYPGQPCNSGDILFSKINPRIPRAIVVPNLGFPLSCSTEFEVMRAKTPFSAYEIMVLLLTSNAQSQIQSLTSGTSSSHNRIKTEQLLNILLPVPRNKDRTKYHDFIEDFKKAHRSLMQASNQLHANWKALDNLLSNKNS